MPVSVVIHKDGQPIVLNGPEGTVVVEGASPGEVGSSAAKALALNTARGFLSKPGISTQGGSYPVGPDGQPLDPMKGLPPGSKYRQDFAIREGF